MIRTTLPFLPALLMAALPMTMQAADDDEHVIAYHDDASVTVSTGDGYTDERTVARADDAGERPCHRHRRRHHHEDEDVQYGWDGVPYSESCGGPAVRVTVVGPCLPPPHVFLPPARVVGPVVACVAHVGVLHGLAAVGVVALKIAAIPLLLPFALHR
jgi:hypothetical protein